VTQYSQQLAGFGHTEFLLTDKAPQVAGKTRHNGDRGPGRRAAGLPIHAVLHLYDVVALTERGAGLGYVCSTASGRQIECWHRVPIKPLSHVPREGAV